MALAQDDADSAPPEQIRTLQHLAEKGYLGDKKDFYLSAKELTEDDITDGLLRIKDQLASLDLKTLQPGDKNYSVEDLKVLLALLIDKSEDIRARKASAWKFRKKVEDMLASLAPASLDATPALVTAVALPSPRKRPSRLPPTRLFRDPAARKWNQMKGDMRGFEQENSRSSGYL